MALYLRGLRRGRRFFRYKFGYRSITPWAAARCRGSIWKYQRRASAQDHSLEHCGCLSILYTAQCSERGHLVWFIIDLPRSLSIGHLSGDCCQAGKSVYHSAVLISSAHWTPSEANHLCSFVDCHFVDKVHHYVESLDWFSQIWYCQTWCGSCPIQLLHMPKLYSCYHRGNFEHILLSIGKRWFDLRLDQAHGRISLQSCTSYHFQELLGSTMRIIRMTDEDLLLYLLWPPFHGGSRFVQVVLFGVLPWYLTLLNRLLFYVYGLIGLQWILLQHFSSSSRVITELLVLVTYDP